MLGEEFVNKIAEIYRPEQTNKAEIKITDLIDQNHLNCIWYGGQVGYIVIDGWCVTIEARGDIRIQGKINGEEFDVVDKRNGGAVYEELGHKIDDEILNRLIQNPDPDNFIEFGNNNWFEFNIETPEGIFVDCCGYDNVIDSDNLLECFDDIYYYKEILNSAKQDLQSPRL